MLKGKRAVWALLALALVCLVPGELLAAQGRLEKVRVHSAALAGNLQGNDADRDVYVYLPPGYAQGKRRYPVVYFLHGYAVTADIYVTSVLNIPAATDAAITAGGPEAIIVMPDAFTRFGGSFYSNSPTIGDWESWIAKDLVGWVDAHYRTIAKREGRGLSGHSMGGYGTLRIGMKYPEVFGALYAMSSAILMQPPDAAAVKTQLGRMAEGIKTEARSMSNGMQAQASAWAPNPQNPPYFFDLPFDADGKPVPLVGEKWLANSLLLTVDQNVPALKSFRAIAMDVGNEDGLEATNTQFSAALKRLGVPHDYEVYAGTHGNRVGARFTGNVLPFFAKHLAAK
ncbi:MAG: alpha/beta hydrolase-fold protein [Steroidobacteraceae bacterium]